MNALHRALSACRCSDFKQYNTIGGRAVYDNDETVQESLIYFALNRCDVERSSETELSNACFDDSDTSATLNESSHAMMIISVIGQHLILFKAHPTQQQTSEL